MEDISNPADWDRLMQEAHELTGSIPTAYVKGYCWSCGGDYRG